ncbi:MAG TPA: flagellar biosynthetic protein FliO [Sphingobium sp.]|uniref:FliO/MopB family protein n=1 Tax=Sphingobium sp. TaxID=1912891 RepID=UPI002ED1DF4E
MFWYFVKLLVLLPMIGGMAFGALWLWRKYQPGMMQAGQANRAVKVVDAVPLGNYGKLAVVEFQGKTLLLSVTRGRIERIAESDNRGF